MKEILAMKRLKEASMTTNIKTPQGVITDYGYGYKTMEGIAP